MRRLSSDAARAYWLEHAATRAPPNFAQDPDVLDNVCHPGLPAWLNAYYARHQLRVYRSLLARVPLRPDSTALEVGCGGGRWCRLLHGRGFAVTGVDLQAALIGVNQARHPEMRFVCGPLEDFAAPPFDLVSCVTVLQHHPSEVQDAMIAKLRRLTRTGGHALILENIHDQGAHVFANRPRGWQQKFAAQGFALQAHQPYDFSPALRLHSLVVRGTASLAVRLGQRPWPQLQAWLKTPAAWQALMHADDLLEPHLGRLAGAERAAVHCGFLFVAT